MYTTQCILHVLTPHTRDSYILIRPEQAQKIVEKKIAQRKSVLLNEFLLLAKKKNLLIEERKITWEILIQALSLASMEEREEIGMRHFEKYILEKKKDGQRVAYIPIGIYRTDIFLRELQSTKNLLHYLKIQ